MNGRCWGLTRNLHRCRRARTRKFFCAEHKKQPLIWLFCLVFTVVPGYASVSSHFFSKPYLSKEHFESHSGFKAGEAEVALLIARGDKHRERRELTKAVDLYLEAHYHLNNRLGNNERARADLLEKIGVLGFV